MGKQFSELFAWHGAADATVPNGAVMAALLDWPRKNLTLPFGRNQGKSPRRHRLTEVGHRRHINHKKTTLPFVAFVLFVANQNAVTQCLCGEKFSQETKKWTVSSAKNANDQGFVGSTLKAPTSK